MRSLQALVTTVVKTAWALHMIACQAGCTCYSVNLRKVVIRYHNRRG
jgi:hypothetical protein